MKLFKKISIVLTLFALVMNVTALKAQLTSYTCDFEDAEENKQWTLNAIRDGWDYKLVNKWWISKAGANEGSRGLYISNDPKGKVVDYEATLNSVLSYRTLEMKKGDYMLSFDWQAAGMVFVDQYNNVTDGDAMYVCWVPSPLLNAQGDSIPIFSNPTSNKLPDWVATYGLVFDDTQTDELEKRALRGKGWTTSQAQINSDGTPHRLVFVWKNGTSINYPPAPSIDNIRINPVKDCQTPTNFVVQQEDDKIKLTWKGYDSDSYEVKVRSGKKAEWSYYNDLVPNGSATTPEKLEITGVEEGIAYFYVRGKCGDKYSPWSSAFKFIFYKGSRCIEYMELKDENCKIGSHMDNGQLKLFKAVDDGYTSRKSRHTLHYLTSERDPRTFGLDGALYTVPEGELASVRLGNWGAGAQAESVEYSFIADADEASLMLLQYAVVMQDPGHPEGRQPYFKLDINRKDKNGNYIPLDDNNCGHASFEAGVSTDSTWHNGLVIAGQDKLLWKDWTIVGINVGDYDGEEIFVRLLTSDCGEGGHYGYAYFTVSCAGGKIEGLSCGDDNKSLAAPVGFEYQWFRAAEPNKFISFERELDINALFDNPDDALKDTTTYGCNVMQIQDNNCYYTIYASSMGRFPNADASYVSKVEDCKNIVDFKSLSKVLLYDPYEKDTLPTDEEIETFYWDFGDGETDEGDSMVSHVYPEIGGKYTVTLTAGIANDKCLDIKTFEINLPDISQKESIETKYVKIGDTYTHAPTGTVYDTTTLIIDTLAHHVYTDCDSLRKLDLVFVNTDTVFEDTVIICTHEYDWHGTLVTDNGTYHATIPSSYKDVDSTMTAEFVINKPLVFNEFPSMIDICADDDTIKLPYDISEGVLGTYSIKFNESSLAPINVTDALPEDNNFSFSLVPLAGNVVPNIYTAKIVMDNIGCGDVTEEVVVNINYSDKIISQRWNDVIGVRNNSFNGGYDFNSYQWYEDDQPIEGATQANLYMPDGLKVGVPYKVQLTRATDSVKLFSCPIFAIEYGGEQTPGSVVFTQSDKLSVKAQTKGIINLWSVSGKLIYSDAIVDGENTYKAPKEAGVYILEIISENGTREIHKLAIR